MTEHIGYKKCRDNKIVILEILGENNEDRNNIIDKGYAKFRCSKARVLEIYNMFDKTIKYTNAFGIYDASIEYKINEIVEPENGFDSNHEIVCTTGIHYFLTEEPAKFLNYKPANGEYKAWYENGQIRYTYTISNWLLDGSYTSFFENRNLMRVCSYKDGRLTGEYKSYYMNGNRILECTYKPGLYFDGFVNSYYDGEYKEYFENGNLMRECSYKDGKKDGLYKEYYSNGQIKEECTYKDGKLVG